MGEEVFRRARHVIGEIERTVQAAEVIRASNWQKAGELMYASHRSLRDDYEVSCTELDAMVELPIHRAGRWRLWLRMTGGGFGGCAVALVKSDSVTAISKTLAAEYKRERHRSDHFWFPTRRWCNGDQELVSFHGGSAAGWHQIRRTFFSRIRRQISRKEPVQAVLEKLFPEAPRRWHNRKKERMIRFGRLAITRSVANHQYILTRVFAGCGQLQMLRLRSHFLSGNEPHMLIDAVLGPFRRNASPGVCE